MAARVDTLIVGGGSAGCVLAARLSDDPARRVVLLEAGPDYPDIAPAPDVVRLAHGGSQAVDQLAALDWGYEAAGSVAGPRIAVPRGRVMGGSGAINGTIFLRGTPEDFASWASLVGPEWAWDQVAPAYRAIEADPFGADADHGRSGPLPIFHWPEARWIATQAAFHEACQELGYGTTDDHNAPDAMGVGALPLNQRDGARISPAIAFLTPEVRARANLTIVPRTMVRRLVITDGRATGVVAESGSGSTTYEAGEVILAAGAVGSPHLLLLAGIGPAADLRALGIPVVADVPGVGVGVRDHPKAWTQWRLRDGLGLDATGPWLQLSARYTATGSDIRGDMMLYPNSVVAGLGPGHVRLPHRGRREPPVSAGSPVAAVRGPDRSSRPSTSRCCRSRATGPAGGGDPPVHRPGQGQPAAGDAVAPGPAGAGGPGQRRGPGCLPRAHRHDRPAHLEQLPHGSRRRPDGRGRRPRPGAGRGRAAGHRLLDHARQRACQHPLHGARHGVADGEPHQRRMGRGPMTVEPLPRPATIPAGGVARSRPSSRCATCHGRSGRPRRSRTSPSRSTAARSTPCWARTAPASRRSSRS